MILTDLNAQSDCYELLSPIIRFLASKHDRKDDSSRLWTFDFSLLAPILSKARIAVECHFKGVPSDVSSDRKYEDWQ
jgi:hypothetical protein